MSTDRWLGLELRHIAALEAVARTRSFHAAARELGYTQSAISQQIAQLEQIVGQRVFDRPGGPRRVELTEAGALLLRHSDAILARLDAARADMAALGSGELGTLRVGIYQSVGQRLLPALLRRFRRQWPRVEVSVREESATVDLLRLVEHGELDLTFAELPLSEGPFEWEELLHDPYVLLVAADSELAARETMPPLRDLARVPLIGRRSTDDPERFLRGRVADFDVIFRTDDNGTVTALVAEGLGAAIEPRLVVEQARGVKLLPAGSRIPPRTIVIAWHRDRYRSAAANAFVELARELGQDYERRTSARTSETAASTSPRPAR